MTDQPHHARARQRTDREQAALDPADRDQLRTETLDRLRAGLHDQRRRADERAGRLTEPDDEGDPQ